METLDGGAGEERIPSEDKRDESKNLVNAEYIITAYCPCIKCCGKTDGITASGVVATEGITVAADTTKLPFGTNIYIDGIGERTVQDIGGAIKGNHIDLYFDTHEEALNFGKQTKGVTILN